MLVLAIWSHVQSLLYQLMCVSASCLLVKLGKIVFVLLLGDEGPGTTEDDVYLVDSAFFEAQVVQWLVVTAFQSSAVDRDADHFGQAPPLR